MDNRSIDFVTSLQSHRTQNQTWDAVSKYFAAEGFTMASHGYAADLMNAKSRTAKPAMRVTCSPGFADFYFDHGFKFDPVLNKRTPGLNPFFTGPDFADIDQDGASYVAIMEEVRTLGLRSGYVIPLLDKARGGLGRFMIGSSLDGKDVAGLIRERSDIYCLAILLTDQRLNVLPSQQEIDTIGLSPREIECLLWLSKGLRVDRIAMQLGIRNVTVNLHFANAKKKLSASTRAQALAKAIWFGLIHP